MGELGDRVKEINDQRKRAYAEIGLNQLGKMEPTKEELDKAVDLCILEGLPVETMNLAQYISQFRSKGMIESIGTKRSRALQSLAELSGNHGLVELRKNFEELLEERLQREVTDGNLCDLADSI